MKNIERALAEAFDAHEGHRKAMSEAREAHRAAKAADEKVRIVRRLERDRAARSPRRRRKAA